MWKFHSKVLIVKESLLRTNTTLLDNAESPLVQHLVLNNRQLNAHSLIFCVSLPHSQQLVILGFASPGNRMEKVLAYLASSDGIPVSPTAQWEEMSEIHSSSFYSYPYPWLSSTDWPGLWAMLHRRVDRDVSPSHLSHKHFPSFLEDISFHSHCMGDNAARSMSKSMLHYLRLCGRSR